jgi:hypothetical protein
MFFGGGGMEALVLLVRVVKIYVTVLFSSSELFHRFWSYAIFAQVPEFLFYCFARWQISNQLPI